MYIGTEYTHQNYYRKSKYGTQHMYTRKKTVVVFQCDNCGGFFKRDKGSMDPNRLNNNYYHVCGNCDAKRFAQEKGVEARKVWDMPVSSLKTLDQL
jgi:predicted RNA-binding Zn-ribbon protein involved in translation (DUF1610 family)